MVKDKEYLTSEIKKIIADIAECQPQQVALEATFYKDLGIDSIKAIEIIVAIEKKFTINIRQKASSKITTVKQTVDLVQRILTKSKNKSK